MIGELARFTGLVELRLGLRIESDRAGSMLELIARRAAAHHEPIASYVDRLEIDRSELRSLAGELTVGETYFFRHVEQFNAFSHVVLPERVATRAPVRVLSAGCSSGEEPYTIAMLARECMADPTALSIHAIDVNPAALARAARGSYSRWALRAIPRELESRWFHTEGRDVIIAPAIRAAVAFEEGNLVADGELWAPGRWDAIFCRNVIMYFTDTRAQEVIGRMIRALVPGGYLFLGHAETLRGRSDDVDLCHTHGAFYYQRKLGMTAGTSATTPTSSLETAATALATNWFTDIQAASERIHTMVDNAQRAPSSTTQPPSLELVRALLGEERFAEALDRLAELPAELAGGRDATLLRAIAYTHTGRLADAEAACTHVLDGGELAGAHYVLALCRESAGDATGAAHHAQLASAVDPSFAMSRLHLGLLARRAGDRRAAAHELERAIALLEREEPERLLLYGGGFGRHALVELCRAELTKATS